jgi:hypothetical protein
MDSDSCDRRADGAQRARRPHDLCNVGIAARLARPDAQQGLPHGALERRAAQVERHVEARRATGEVLGELHCGRAQQRIVGPLGRGERTG